MMQRKQIMTAALVVAVLGVASLAHASTYYLDAINGSDTTGDGSSGSPWASMSKVFTVVGPGDTVLLRPGNYGSVTFEEGQGLGSSAGRVTYQADPATTTPRAADWFEEELARPDPGSPGGKVIFTNLNFDWYSLDWDSGTKTGTPAGHYVTLDGLNVVGSNININSYVSHITIRNCNVFGNWGEYSSEVSGNAFNMYRAVALGSNYQNILIEDCYGTRCKGGFMMLGNFTDITVRGCHFYYHCGALIRLQGNNTNVVVDGNHANHQVPLADTLKHTLSVASPGSPANQVFTVTGDVTYWDHVAVTDASTGTEELRDASSFNHSTYEVVLTEPLSFNVAPGDTVKFWDDSHGSGVSVRTDNFTLRNNRVHDGGATAGMYWYSPPSGGYENIIMENNLIYDSLNQYTVEMNGGLGNGCRIVNNTIVGRKHSNYDTNGSADLLHGFAMTGASVASGANPATIEVCNNLLVGKGSTSTSAIVKNNIVYDGTGFEEDSSGNNANNIVIYGGEPVGSEPQPFHGSGNYFVGSPEFDAWAFDGRHGLNFNDAFRLVAAASAVGYADPATATATDMTGATRDANPDVGCYEYDGVVPNYPPTADAGPDQEVTDSDDNGSEDITLDGSGSSDSDGTIVSYMWEENSSQIATGVSPVVTLSVAVHSIDLTVTDDDSDTDTDSVQITVNPYGNIPPTADAGPDQNVTDTDENGSEDVTLDGSGSSDSDGTIVSYVWEENSSQIATGVSPLVTLDVNVHTIDLTVTDDESATDSDSVVITVQPGGVPQNIVYDNVSSAVINPGTTLSWSHTIGGGSNRLLVVGTGTEDDVIGSMAVTSVTYNGVAMTPVAGGSSTVDTGFMMKVDLYYMLEANLPAAGTYTVVVTYAAEVDQIGAGAISLANAAQQAAEAVNTATSTSTSISTNLTTLTDGAWIVDIAGCGNPGSFTATGGQTERFDVVTASSTSAASTMEVATAGSATVSWDYDGTVNRASLAAAAFAPATGAPPVNDPPVADAGPDQNVTDNDDNGSEDVTLDGSGSSDSDGTIISYVWEENSSQIATGVSPVVTLSVAVHTIDLVVTDDDSDTDTDSVVITVNPYVNVPPAADAGPDQNVTDIDDSGDEDVTLDGSGSSDSDGTITDYDWEESSVPIATGVSPVVTLSVAVHTIDLTVTDDDSATDSDSVQITVNPYVNVPPTADAGPDQNVTDTDEGGDEDITLDGSGSSDSDGTITDHDWEEASVPIATGVSPVVTLTVAVHTIDLTVTDDDSATDSDSVVITVNAGGAPANIAFDAVSSSAGTSTSSLSWSHTIGGGNNRILIVGVENEDDVAGDMVISSVTYNSVAMDLVAGTQATVGSSAMNRTALYYLLDTDLPAAGTYTVAVTYAGENTRHCAGAISLAEVAQQAAEAVAINSNGFASEISTDITTVTDGAWVVDAVQSGHPNTMTATGAGMVERYNTDGSLGQTGAGSTLPVATAGVATMSWDFDGTDSARLVHSLAAFAPATGPPANDPPTADAGPDQNVTDNDDSGDEDVTLDGSGSSDSDGTIVSYEWEEASVPIASGVSPLVTLSVAVHTIDLIVTDDDTDTDTDSVVITVNPYVNVPPTADAGPDQNVNDTDDGGDEDVTLDGSGSSDSDGTIVSYEWEEASVPIASGVSPVVTLTVGIHTIDLIVTDDDTDTDTDSVVIDVNAPPTADAGPDQNVTDTDDGGDEDVTLDGSGSSDSDGSITAYDWEEASVPIASGVSPLVTLSVAVHTIDLIVTDNDSATDTDSVVVTVNPYVNVPPTADAGPDQLVTDADRGGDEDVTLDGSGSSDSDGTIVSYEWEEASVPIASGVSPLVTLAVGTHTIDLIVTDDDTDTDTDSVSIEVNDPPAADAGPDQNVTDTDDGGDEDVTLDGSGSSDSDGSITDYDWEEASVPIASGVSPLVTLSVAVHTIDLIVTDDDSATDTDSVMITVNPYVNVPPTADAGPDQNVTDADDSGDEDVTLDGSGSSDSDGTITAYDWEEASVPIASGVSPLVTLSVAVHTIDLIVTDDDSDTDTDSVQITVNPYVNVPPTADAGPDQNVTDTDDSGDEDVTLDGSGSSDSDGTITDYDWEEASVPIASGVSPLVTLSVGVHTIDLIVTDDDSDTDTDSVQITVNPYVNVPPTADAGPDQNVTDTDQGGDEDVTLDGSASSDSDGTITDYDWEEASVPIATGVSPVVTLSVAVHTIDLTVTDDDSATDSDSVVITVNAGGAPATIEFDAASSGNTTNGTSVSWSHTIGAGSNRLLVVGTAGEDSVAGDLVISSVTFNGVAMAAVAGGSTTIDNGYKLKTDLYYILEADLPAAGTYTVVVTYAGELPYAGAGAISLENAAQQPAEAVNTATSTDPVAISCDVTTLTDGAWLVDVVGCGNPDNFTPTAGQAERYDRYCVGCTVAGGSKPVATAGVATMSWDYDPGNANRMAQVVAAFAPASGGPPVNDPPVADAGPDQNVTDNDDNGSEDVTLDGSGSSDSDGTIVSYEWEEASVPIATGVSPLVTLSVAVHTINLTVTDDDSATDSDSVQVTVDPYVNVPPTADAGPDQNVTDNDDSGTEDVTLDGSGSSDSDGTIAAYDWEEASVPIASGVSPLVTLSVAVHTIDLIVTDDDSDTDTDSVQITVNAYVNVPPTADAGPDQNVTDTDQGGDEDVTLDGSGSSDSDGTIVSYDWEEASVPIATGVSPVVTLDVNVHTIDLTVTDDDSDTDSDSVVITVNAGGAPANIEFDAASSSAANNTSSLSWSHTIGGGANRILIVGVENEDNKDADLVITSVTYDGVAMSLVAGSEATVGSSWKNRTALYYLLDASLPAAGSYTVAVTYAGENTRHCAGAISLTGVAQQAAEAVATNSDSSASSISTNITTLTDGAWVVDAAHSGHPNAMVGTAAGMVDRYSTSGSGGQTGAGATKEVATAGSTTMSWEYNGGTGDARLSHSVAAFAPAN